MSPGIGYGSYHISQLSRQLNSMKLIWLVYWNVSHFDILVLVLNKNHVGIKIDREKFTHHYCRSNPIRDGPLCLKPKYYSGALNILVLNGSHHVAAATWRESKNFFPLFSFSSPSSLHVSCTAAATGMRTMEKREEEHTLLFPFFQDNRPIKLLLAAEVEHF